MVRDIETVEKDYKQSLKGAWGLIQEHNELRAEPRGALFIAPRRSLKRAWGWVTPLPQERFLEGVEKMIGDVDYKLHRLGVMQGGFDPKDPIHKSGLRMTNTISPIRHDFGKLEQKDLPSGVLPALGSVKNVSFAFVATMYEARAGFPCCDIPEEVQDYLRQPVIASTGASVKTLVA